MDLASSIVVALGGACIGFLISAPFVIYQERRYQRKAALLHSAVRRPIAPRADGQRVTHDASQPSRRARVSTAHVSQPRRAWK